MKYAFALLLLATPALAENPMTGAEFEAYAKGRTLTFSSQSGPYGVERYLPGRRVIWSFLDDECQEGAWYEEEIAGDPAICFLYDFDPEPKCWAMYLDGERLRAEYLNQPGTSILYEALEGEEALICGFGV